MELWEECKERISIKSISGTVTRVVESQEQIATNSLVDNLQEQDLLEHLLEQTKPPIKQSNKQFHYLLNTPFRYPPLMFGSRFGSRIEPGLFYGSLTLNTALAETAYYRFLFWLAMTEPPPSGKFVTQHTVFTAAYSTNKGVQLQYSPFSDYIDMLTHPENYTVTQSVGKSMREEGVEAFEFVSARDKDRGINVALFNPNALAAYYPLSQQQWLCELNVEQASFYTSRDGQMHQFSTNEFMFEGRFPIISI